MSAILIGEQMRETLATVSDRCYLSREMAREFGYRTSWVGGATVR